ncbi:MAG: hypothetical protein R8G66_09770 [Cytophagales bacterium]|nr:hypothetical protein [Cytophagales bacterium]
MEHGYSDKQSAFSSSGHESPPKTSGAQLKGNRAIDDNIDQLQTLIIGSDRFQTDARQRKAIEASTVGQKPLSNSEDPIQRIIIHVGDGGLRADMARPDKGWITSSTLQVAIEHGPPGQAIIEADQIRHAGEIGQHENIYFVGHGMSGYMGVTDPRALADATGLILPEGYDGKIISLNCSSGQGVGASAVADFTERLNLLGVVVDGPRGPSLHHPDIPGKVRVIRPARVNAVSDQINATQGATQEAWRKKRNEIIHSTAYALAGTEGKIRLLAAASVELSSVFYRALVIWADARGYLYPIDESHTRSEMVEA